MHSALLFSEILTGAAAGIVWQADRVDSFLLRHMERVKSFLQQQNREEQTLQGETEGLQQLLLALRSGQSLDSSLQQQNLRAFSSPTRLLLQSSLESGAPCGPTLQFLRHAKSAELRSRRKLRAITLGARMQAVVLAAVPWILLSSFSVLDPEMSHPIFENPLCWAIWFFCALLCAAGFLWMRKILRRSLEAHDPIVAEQESLLTPALLEIMVHVGAGKDIGEAVGLATQELPQSSTLRSSLVSFAVLSNHDDGPWRGLRLLLRKAQEHGVPLREEIMLLLEELQNQKESRWEELVQKLPLKMLPPLFSCFFLAALLISFSLLIPFLSSF